MNLTILITTAGSIVILLFALAKQATGERRFGYDFFSPVVVISFFYLLTVPSMLIMSFDDTGILSSLASWAAVHDPENALAWAAIWSMVALACTFLGAMSSRARHTGQAWGGGNLNKHLALPRNKHAIAIIASLALAVVLYAAFLSAIGGLGAVWGGRLYAGHADRQGLTGLTLPRAMLLKVAIVSAAAYLANRKTSARYIVFFGVTSLAFAIQVSLGSRSHGGVMIFTALIAYNYFVKRAGLFQLKYYILIGALLIFAFFWGAIRHEGDPLDALLNPTDVLERHGDYADRILVHRLNNIERRAIVVSAFPVSDLWWGRSYVDLIFAPIPRRLFPNKPPIEEGTYLINIARGHRVAPPFPYLDMPSISGIPPGNWVGYMNFHVPGLMFLSFISGFLLSVVYHAMRTSGFQVGWIIIYSTLAFRGGFSITNPTIFGTIALVMATLFFLWAIRLMQRLRIRG